MGINIKIITPQSTLYSGTAQSISSFNSKGKFDILVNHSHFVSEIQKKIIIIDNENNEKVFNLKNGVIRCANNEVQIYIVQ